MSRYIVKPKQSLATRGVGLITKKLLPEKRQAQIAEVVALRKNDPVFTELNLWIKHSNAVYQLASENQTQVTGTRIIEMSEEDAQRLRKDIPDVLILRDQPIGLIEPAKTAEAPKSKVTKNDLWHLDAINLTNMKSRGFKGNGSGVTIAILDTGVDGSHPEISTRVNGTVTFDVNTWTINQLPESIDTSGHGTHVAGLICGEKVGIAPGASVLNGMMIPNGEGYISDFIFAMEWAGAQPEVSIVNMSAGIPGYFPEMLTAMSDLLAIGVLPVIATGNEGRNRTRSPGNYVEALSVGASNRTNQVCAFSSGGVIVADSHSYEVPDLVAPGEGIFSCVMGGGYEAWDGTSMATPIVSGVAALILEKFPDISVPNLIEALLTSCIDLGFPKDRQGQGLIQVR